MSIGNFPESLSHQILVGIILAGRLGVHDAYEYTTGRPGEAREARALAVLALRAGTFRRRPALCLHFSICACHPGAGAMLIFSASFQV